MVTPSSGYETSVALVAFAGAGEMLRSQLRSASTQGEFLSPAALAQLQQQGDLTQPQADALHRLHSQAEAIVGAARQQLLEQQPQLTAPGGGLYPPERGEACWRDLWHFLRCISYGIALANPDYLRADGLAALEQLYRRFGVPLDAMVIALTALKQQALERLPAPADRYAPYFDRLISCLEKFHPQP